jgi:ketosteroid isomerase-like protein
MISPYGPTAKGRDAIEAAHADWTSEGGENKKLQILEFGGTDSLAWGLAKFSEGEATGEGTSLNVFERQTDGNWLIRMCSLNAEAA